MSAAGTVNGSGATNRVSGLLGDDRATTKQNLQRILPHSVEAEQGVLGSILKEPQHALMECQGKINQEYFYVQAHQTIYGVLEEMAEKKQAIDLITLTQTLDDKNVLEQVGGPVAVTQLFTFVPTAANVTYYLEIVRDKFILRQVIASGTEGVRRAFEEQDDVMTLVDRFQQQVTAIALDRNNTSPLVPVKETVPEVIDQIEKAFEQRGRVQGLQTGFVDFDRMTNGLHPGEMIVIAARPSMGKTALAMNIVETVAFDRTDGKWEYKGVPVAVFSLETSRARLVRRQIASRARVSIQKIREGFLAEADFPKLTEAAGKLQTAPIYIDDTPGLRLFELKARLRWAVVKLGVKLAVIDYLQLLKNPSKRAEFSRVLELTEISAGIKEIGRELNIPIITLAQLNRETEKREGGRPRMADLRECGAIEQDADLIALLYRPEQYAEDEESKRELCGQAELIIAKQKDGPTGPVHLTFLKEFTRFEDRAVMIGGEEVHRPLYSNNPKLRQSQLQHRADHDD